MHCHPAEMRQADRRCIAAATAAVAAATAAGDAAAAAVATAAAAATAAADAAAAATTAAALPRGGGRFMQQPDARGSELKDAPFGQDMDQVGELHGEGGEKRCRVFRREGRYLCDDHARV